jgi:dienelactone hydrolase
MGKILRRLLVLISLVTVLITAGRQIRIGVKTALLLPQIIPSISFKPQELFTSTPTRIEVSFPVSDGQQIADLYIPVGGDRYSAALLFLGVHPAGRNDERIVGLAEGLARTGHVVMVPWSDYMTQGRIQADDVEVLVSAFQFLQKHPRVEPERIWMGGFCVGASFSLVAAADPRISDHVRFVNFFGGYYSAADLLKSVTSRSSFYGGTEKFWDPDILARDVLTNHLIESVEDVSEQKNLLDVYNNGEMSIEAFGGLSVHGKVVHQLLSGVTLEEADTLFDQLSPELHQLLSQVSPGTYVQDIQVPVLIMHDRNDTLVPVEESRRLRDALKGRANVYYTEFSFFEHMDPTRPVSKLTFVRDIFKLFLHMQKMLKLSS